MFYLVMKHLPLEVLFVGTQTFFFFHLGDIWVCEKLLTCGGCSHKQYGSTLWKKFSHAVDWFYINKHNKVRLPRGFYRSPFKLHSKVTHFACERERWPSQSRVVFRKKKK